MKLMEEYTSEAMRHKPLRITEIREKRERDNEVNHLNDARAHTAGRWAKFEKAFNVKNWNTKRRVCGY